LLKAVFAYAVKKRWIARNPVTGEGPHEVKREPRFLTAEEVGALASAVPPSSRALVLLLAWCGPRVGEALALQVSDVDFLKRRVRIERRVKEVPGEGLDVDKPKTAAGRRSVPMPAFIVDELSAQVAEFCPGTDRDRLLFTSPRGGYIHESTWRKSVFYPACDAAGITPRPHVHDLRHTSASLMHSAGFTLLEAGAWLGHTNASMTAMYSHLFDDELDAKAAKLDARWRQVGERASG
jgi:integrase